MITVITGIIIIIYCLFNLLYIDSFMSKFQSELEGITDAFMFLSVCIWLVIEFFYQSGIICAIPFVPMAFNVPKHLEYRKKNFYIIILTTILIVTSFVILNKLWFNFNFWTFKF
jgi:hypothetical protein